MTVKTPILFDTDMDTDCDDAGALSVLHALADEGRADLLAVICDVPIPWCAPCVRAINSYYNRPDIPVGEILIEDYASNPRYAAYARHRENLGSHRHYNEIIARTGVFAANNKDVSQNALEVYRRTLAAQEDGSVVICAVGVLSALEQLLKSPPDAVSPLSGLELVNRKVRLLVSMGKGEFPEGSDSFNWKMDAAAAAYVLENWPGTVVISPMGAEILTGARLSLETPAHNPVRRAYEIWLQGEGKSRASWDQVALWYAVCGADGLFEERTSHRLGYDPKSGRHHWTPNTGKPVHILLSPLVSSAHFQALIEDKMTARPLLSPG